MNNMRSISIVFLLSWELFSHSLLSMVTDPWDTSEAHFTLLHRQQSALSQIAKKLKENPLDFDELNRGESRETIKAFVAAYIQLFYKFPKAFSPYSPLNLSRNRAFDFLLKDICEGGLEKICEHHSVLFQSQILNSFSVHKPLVLEYKDAELVKNAQEALRQLEFFYHKQQGEYKQYQMTANRALHNFLQKSMTNNISHDNVNASLQQLWMDEVRQAALDYHQERTARLKKYPARILLAPHMQRLIEGGHFQLDLTDLFIAVEQLRKQLKSQLLLSLIKTTMTNPELYPRQKDIVAGQLSEKERKVMALMPEVSLTFFTQWHGQDYLQSGYYPLTSNVFPPFAYRGEFADLAVRYHGMDPKAFRFLAQGKVQRAIWQLMNIHREDLANAVKTKMQEVYFAQSHRRGVSGFSLGLTKTMISHYQYDFRGLYKPRINKYLHPLNAVAGGHKKEVAAYVLDEILELNMVPYTRRVKIDSHPYGSEQYFVDEAFRARELINYNGHKPRKLLESPRGRVVKTRNIHFFDWLIANGDRNNDNYMYFYDGKVILIDNGFSFLSIFSNSISTEKVRQILPSTKVYQNLVKLNSYWPEYYPRLKPLLKSGQIYNLKKRIENFIKKSEKLLDDPSTQKYFAQADAEEKI